MMLVMSTGSWGLTIYHIFTIQVLTLLWGKVQQTYSVHRNQ